MKTLASLFSLRLLIHLILIRPFLHIFHGVYISGRKHLVGLDQYMVIANHNSHLDILLLFSVLPVGDILTTRPLAAEEYFSRNRAIFRILNYIFKPIWIVRGDKECDLLAGIREALRSGRNIIIFPEGTRGEPGVIASFKTGIGRLAVEFRQIPIVPVHLSGPERSFPKRAILPLPIWNNVTIGPPHVYTGDCEDITASLEKTIRGLSESESALRHKRKLKKGKTSSIAFLGIDGSGKSTLSREAAKRLSDGGYVCLLTDRLEFFRDRTAEEIQPLLIERVRETIGGYAKKAKSLKHYKIPKLAEILLRDHLLGDVRKWYSPDYLIQDGSPLLNLIAWAVLYKGETVNERVCARVIEILTGRAQGLGKSDPIYEQFPELRYLKKLGFAHMKLPDAVIFLDVAPAVSCERIRSRGERTQVHETEEKLTQLRNGYHMVCGVIEKEFGLPLLVLEGERDLEQLAVSASDFIRSLFAGDQHNE